MESGLVHDESHFCLSNYDGHVRVYRRNGEGFTDTAAVQHDGVGRTQCDGLGWDQYHQKNRTDYN